MKLNCDMGESFGSWKMGRDAEIMPYVDMANIACGFHAADPQTMSDTIALAVKHNVTIGAHPGYPDLLGFGRKEIAFSANEITNIVLYQVGALQAICAAHGTVVSYVKPHGALYNVMMRDIDVYQGLIKAISHLRVQLPLMIMATPNNQQHIDIAKQANVALLFEAFCDRAYTDEGSLQARQIKGAVHQDINIIAEQARTITVDQTVNTVSGNTLNIAADTLCIHGDGELALPSVRKIRDILPLS